VTDQERGGQGSPPPPGSGEPDPEDRQSGLPRPLHEGASIGGGLTEATGALTPEDSDEPFVPAERREAIDPRLQGAVTVRQQRVGDARRVEQAVGGHSEGDHAMGPGAPGSLAGPRATEAASGLSGLQGEESMGFSTTPGAGTVAGTGATELAQRDAGYHTSHGLDPDDPAYRMETNPVPGGDPSPEPPVTEEGDEYRQGEEHL
jgi:hypothetical protein